MTSSMSSIEAYVELLAAIRAPTCGCGVDECREPYRGRTIRPGSQLGPKHHDGELNERVGVSRMDIFYI